MALHRPPVVAIKENFQFITARVPQVDAIVHVTLYGSQAGVFAVLRQPPINESAKMTELAILDPLNAVPTKFPWFWVFLRRMLQVT